MQSCPENAAVRERRERTCFDRATTRFKSPCSITGINAGASQAHTQGRAEKKNGKNAVFGPPGRVLWMT